MPKTCHTIHMIRKKYEVIKDGMLEGGFEKSRDGMNEALQLVEELAVDYMGEYDCLEIVYTEYDELEQIVHCEQVQEFEDDSLGKRQLRLTFIHTDE